MKQKKLIIISSVVAAVIVLMGLVGGSVLASSGSSSTDTSISKNPDSAFAAKVAAILGIDQDKVEAAFAQAKQEMRTEAEDARLAKLVEDGVITQDQADQYKAWLDSKPDVPALDGMQGGMQGERGGMMGPGMGCPSGEFGQHGQRPDSPTNSDNTTDSE